MLQLTDMEVVHLLLLLAFMAGILGAQVACIFGSVVDHLADRFLEWEDRRARINAARANAARARAYASVQVADPNDL